MKYIFFDCEFTDLEKTPKLISIGLISDDGKTFYAELRDTYAFEDCSDFVLEHVLPLLEGGEALMRRRELRDRLREWLESFNEPVTLVTDSLAFDWPRIQELYFQNPARWPANLVPSPALLNVNYLRDYEAFEPALERAFAAGLRRHHALDDAKANREACLAAGGMWEAPKPQGRFTV